MNYKHSLWFKIVFTPFIIGIILALSSLLFIEQEMTNAMQSFPVVLDIVFESPAPYSPEQIIMSQVALFPFVFLTSGYIRDGLDNYALYAFVREGTRLKWFWVRTVTLFFHGIVYVLIYFIGIISTAIVFCKDAHMYDSLHSIGKTVLLCGLSYLFWATMTNTMVIRLGTWRSICLFLVVFILMTISAAVAYDYEEQIIYTLNPISHSYADWKSEEFVLWIPGHFSLFNSVIYWLVVISLTIAVSRSTLLLTDIIAIGRKG